ncbi:universal stress protein [Arvimicrobium flavum]|uniref:universal stress protein n=1 Tax=Arvimicrobium flavum TaxID=3393320 RepID=UPI00237A9E09|nr:universal stress protein [Mesorhizobium shangrilense]
MYSHLLITTDGSELAQKGVDHGIGLAKALGSKVLIVTVTEPFPPMATGMGDAWAPTAADIDRYEASQTEHARAILAAAQADADKQGVAVETMHVSDQHPATAIIETAAARDCSLIVMASHGRRGLSRLLLGSQTSEVLSHSNVPVLVVR